MAETQLCPYCGSEIPIKATRCKFCREWLVDPDQIPAHAPAPAPEAPQPVEPAMQSPEEQIKNHVIELLKEPGGFLKAIDYYSEATGCTKGEARKYADRINASLHTEKKSDRIVDPAEVRKASIKKWVGIGVFLLVVIVVKSLLKSL